MYINFFKASLLLISSAIIIISGYRCAGYTPPWLPGAPQGENSSRTNIPLPDPNSQTPTGDSDEYRDDDYYYDDEYLETTRREEDERDSLPSESERCHRETIRNLADRYGSMGVLEFDTSALEDYRMGAEENFPIKCPRIYLNLRQIGSKKTFRGKMAISYQTENEIKLQEFDSGYNESDNANNRWGRGSWPKKTGSRSNRESRKPFNAIFEDEDSAIILRIKKVHTKDLRDGKVAYFGSGELFYKMFRYSDTAGRGDECYTSGTYMRFFNQRDCAPGYRCSSIPRRGKCWKIAHGPYSCLPNGALSPSGGRARAVPKINITAGLKCFRELATFKNINIEEAFNVESSVNELD